MNLRIFWHSPFDLVSAPDLIYDVQSIEDIPEAPGIYIFVRSYGDSLAPLYVGKAGNLFQRIGQQLNNTRLMKGIENAQKGYRQLLIGELQSGRGQQSESAIAILETTFIQYFLAEGHELLNKQGTKTHVHSISSEGNRVCKRFFPTTMTHRRD